MGESRKKGADFLNAKRMVQEIIQNKWPGSREINGLSPCVIRMLEPKDLDKGLFDLLSVSTKGKRVKISRAIAQDQLAQTQLQGGYFVIVAVDRGSGRVLGTGSLSVEQKFIHEAGTRGRVEDIVTCPNKDADLLASQIMDVLLRLAMELSVYKCSVECPNELISFCEKFGFKVSEGNNLMTVPFPANEVDALSDSMNGDCRLAPAINNNNNNNNAVLEPKNRKRVPSVTRRRGIHMMFNDEVLERIASEVEAVLPFPNGSNFKIRPLSSQDRSKGFLDILSQLTDVGNVDEEAFNERFLSMQTNGDYYVVVIEDGTSGRVVASTTMFLERSYAMGPLKRGRIEDVVVCKSMRGKKFGKILLEVCTRLSAELGAYACSLECKDALIGFYNSFGYQVDHTRTFMVRRFPGPSPSQTTPRIKSNV